MCFLKFHTRKLGMHILYKYVLYMTSYGICLSKDDEQMENTRDNFFSYEY